MPASDPSSSNALPATRLRLAAHWGALVLASIGAAWLLHEGHVSAALLLGPIFAAIVFAARETPVRVPRPAFVCAQAVVGCMIARTIPATLVGEVGKSWPLFVAGVGSVLLLSALLGWAMARWRVLPGTTAVWGSFPGAATAMVLMGGAFGADTRLVALMQYLRVLLVGIAATTVTRLWVPVHAASVPLIPPHAPIHALAFAETLALAGTGAWFAVRLKIPAGGLLVPMFAGVVLLDTGLLAIELPWWLLAGSYALVGWSIGLGFTPTILRHAARAAARAGRHLHADRAVRRPRVGAVALRARRSADGLPRHEPRRGGHRGDHREFEPGRRALRDGDAVGPFHRRGVLRAGDRALRRAPHSGVNGNQCRISGCCGSPV